MGAARLKMNSRATLLPKKETLSSLAASISKNQSSRVEKARLRSRLAAKLRRFSLAVPKMLAALATLPQAAPLNE